MRILRLSFQNLNSLTGRWELDFTGPAFSDGIFAITGPTGAGKTTILDALCLALYGRTPRLDKINQSSNEIMSRQSGECSAEADFATLNGTYRCSWHQRRTRKKPNGQLQPPKREISVLGSGQILANSIKEADAKIEEITGMDFDRFTRSMLLAQGGFAAFLQASPDERSPILEQITGSGMYTEISKRVHERCKAENERQKQLQEQAAILCLLTGDEELAVQQELGGLRAEELRLKAEIEHRTAALAWLERIAALRMELAAIAKEQERLAVEQEIFAAEAKRLAAAELSLALKGEHAELSAVRKQQKEDLQAAAKLRLCLPELETVVTAAAEQLHNSNSLLAEYKTAQQAGSVRIRQVRELDLRIQEQAAALRKQVDSCAALWQKNAAEQQQCGQLEQAISQARTRQEKSGCYLFKHQTDERLLAELTGICWLLEQLNRQTARCDAVRSACVQAEKLAAAAVQNRQEKAQCCSAAEQQLATAKMELAAVRQESDVLLQDRRMEDLHREQGLLTRLQEMLQQQEKITQEIAELIRLQEQTATAHNELTANFSVLSRRRDEARQEAERQRELAVLARRIRDLEAERLRLRDNCPCPLCGSLEHPYAQGNLTSLDAIAQQEQTSLAAAQLADQVFAAEQIKAARLEKEAQHLTERIAEKKAATQETEQQFSSCRDELAALVPATEYALPWQNSEHLLAALAERSEKNRQLFAVAEQLDKKRTHLAQAIEQLQAVHFLAQQAQDKAHHAAEKAEAEQKRLKDEQQCLDQELAESRSQALTALAVYGIAALPFNRLEQVAAELTARKEQWQRQQSECRAAEQQVADFQSKLRELRAGMAVRTGQLEAAEPLLNEQREQLAQLTRTRTELFADKQPDAEERQLAEAVRAAEQAVQQAQEKHGNLLAEFERQQAAVNSRETAALERAPQLQQLEAAFACRLEEHGFADEAAWLSAGLADEQRLALRSRAEDLRSRQTRLDERRQDRETRLAAEEQLRLTATGSEQLRQELAELNAASRQTTEKIGAATQQLRDNEQRRSRQHALLRSVEAQKKETLRWKMLHDLIGSADGKKYRNFAQGLTFEQMVVQANRQLAKMNGRYLLIRDEQQPLELNVVDSWQADEIRSAKNLSGGESFVVSLALALGLASMVGGKVQVESLFLDEGFGTLDDEALETALESLSELRREGRLIGVISHVAALKERIACQIEVVPGPGGRSVIRGPGVRRVN